MFVHPKRNVRPAPRPGDDQAISTEEFYRQLFAQAKGQAPEQPEPSARPALNPEQFTEMSFEEFYRELFAQGKTRQPLGPRQGLEPPALPARFKRIRGGNHLVSYELLVGEDGRIVAKHENVAGVETYFIYEYDESGHLLRAWRGGKLAEEYAYDERGARVAAWSEQQGEWKYAYDQRGRLTSAGPWQFAYAEDGTLREAWTPEAAWMLWYNQEGGLSRISLPGHRILRCESMAPGLPVEKYLDARPVESFTWRSPLQLATYQDHQRGLKMAFHYNERSRLPQAVTVQGSQGQATYLLGFDQVGSLKAAASREPDGGLRVVKVMDYDAFGNILSDSNPGLFLPLGFAGGLRDRFTGLVRFCHRDYDPTVGRFTAQDPLGDTGGDHDLYEYCVDDPVNAVDPEGLQGEAAASGGSWWDGAVNATGELFKKTKEWFVGPSSPSPADVTRGTAGAAADAAQAVTEGYDTVRSAGAQVSRGVPEVISNLPVSPKEVGAALKAGEVAQQVGAATELGKIAKEGAANATARNVRINDAINRHDYDGLEPALKEYLDYYEKLVPGALREGGKMAPTPIGPGPIKR